MRDHVSTVLPNLPEGTKSPVISKLDPDAAPVLFVALESPRPIREVTEFADHEVRQALENVSGVGQVTIVGGRKRQIQVCLDPVRLRAAGLTAVDVQRAIVAQNISTPGGSVDTGPQRLTFRVSGRVESVEAVEEIVVRSVGGHPILIRDVGQRGRRRGGGRDRGEHRRQAGGGAVDPQAVGREHRRGRRRAARAHGGDRPRRSPAGYKLNVIRDNTESIRTSVDAVKEHLILGALLAALVVLLFLGNLRSTIIAALAIPISIIGTFVLMWLLGFTLNTITLLALALAVGIVIDDAIVVLENIFRFIDEKKIRPMPAAIYATREIGLAVLATTLSLLAVFLPVAFMRSIPGRFLRSFGLTMGASIAISLFVSFTLTPMLASRWLRLDLAPPESAAQVAARALVDWFYRPIERLYMAILGWVMRPPLDRRGRLDRDAGLLRAAGQGGAEGLPAQERRGAVRDQRARARGDQPGRDPDRRRADRARGARSGPRWRRRWSPSATTSRRRPTWRRSTSGCCRRTSAGCRRTSCRTRSRREILPAPAEGLPDQHARRWRPSAPAPSAARRCSTS